MNKHSIKRLKEVHLYFTTVVEEIERQILISYNLQVEVVQGLRTIEYQNELYAQGRTKSGKVVTNARGGFSFHNFGLAVDLCPFKNAKPWWEAPIEIWTKMGRIAEEYGLEWGGDWSVGKVDLPHIQIPYKLDRARTLYASGGLNTVWKKAQIV